jgi:hypothetical protein
MDTLLHFLLDCESWLSFPDRSNGLFPKQGHSHWTWRGVGKRSSSCTRQRPRCRSCSRSPPSHHTSTRGPCLVSAKLLEVFLPTARRSVTMTRRLAASVLKKDLFALCHWRALMGMSYGTPEYGMAMIRSSSKNDFGFEKCIAVCSNRGQRRERPEACMHDRLVTTVCTA